MSRELFWIFPVFENDDGDIPSITLKYIGFMSRYIGGGKECIDFQIGRKVVEDSPEVQTEKELLMLAWEMINCYVTSNTILAGWRLYERYWPLFINRTLANGIPLPVWARHDPTKRYSTLTIYDLYNIYTQGKRLDYRDRDLTLPQVLSMWNPSGPPIAAISPGEPVPDGYGCTCIIEMQKIAEQYETPYSQVRNENRSGN